MSLIKRFPEQVGNFIVTRYPLWMAFALLMMISDQEDPDSATLPARLLYANIGMTLLCGFTLSMSHMSSKMSLVFAGQLAYQAYNLLFNPQFKLEPFLRHRLAVRALGLMAIYALYAFFHDLKAKKVHNSVFNVLGHLLLAAFFGGLGYLVKYGDGERRAFLHHVNDAAAVDDSSSSTMTLNVVFWTFVILSALFLSRKFSRYSFKTSLFVLALYSFYIDCDVGYWRRVGVPLWTQIRIISDNVGIMGGLLLIEVSHKRNKLD